MQNLKHRIERTERAVPISCAMVCAITRAETGCVRKMHEKGEQSWQDLVRGSHRGHEPKILEQCGERSKRLEPRCHPCSIQYQFLLPCCSPVPFIKPRSNSQSIMNLDRRSTEYTILILFPSVLGAYRPERLCHLPSHSISHTHKSLLERLITWRTASGNSLPLP